MRSIGYDSLNEEKKYVFFLMQMILCLIGVSI